jgi:hypothetical protein
MNIEISEGELVCLLFWNTVYRCSTVPLDEDNKLFNKLVDLYNSIPSEEHRWHSGMPPYQPGEGPK